jgi:hypothetical protein
VLKYPITNVNYDKCNKHSNNVTVVSFLFSNTGGKTISSENNIQEVNDGKFTFVYVLQC